MVRDIGTKTGFGGRIESEVARQIEDRDQSEQPAIQRMGGRRVLFRSRDDFALGGVLAAREGARNLRGAIVIVSPTDTIADYDSLTIALERSGHAVMLLDVRGSGWSVAPSCPLADTWQGREAILHTRVAHDVREALRALAIEVPLDTTRYVVVGVGPTASMAVEAATYDSRVGALVLVSPRPDPLEQGPMRARIASLALPIFYQIGPEDFENSPLIDAFYQAGNRGASRIAEARVIGHGPAQFHRDPAVAARLTRWLDETLPRNARHGSRPSPPRGGPGRRPTTTAKGNARPRG
jgi:hypothetical protein